MKITDVKIRKLFTQNILCAIASVTFDNCFTVHDIKIVCVDSKYFIVMPNKKYRDGKIADVAHPINKEFREEMEQAVLSKYKEAVKENAEIL